MGKSYPVESCLLYQFPGIIDPKTHRLPHPIGRQAEEAIARDKRSAIW